MTKKTALNEPIVLSGRVYLAGFLAETVNGFDLPATLRVGDIKLHNVAKAGKRQRFGQPVEFSGFFAASIWNGKRYCRLLMRKKAAMDATYMGLVELRSKARTCVLDLRRLSALQAVWVAADHGYEVTYNASSHPLAHTPPLKDAAPAKDATPAKDTTPVKDTAPAMPVAERPSFVRPRGDLAAPAAVPEVKETVATAPLNATETETATKPGGTSPVVPGQQLPLFPDMPVSTGGKKRRRKR
ncbi:MAG: hypothetical protein WCT03_26870 [Candidatus Obscuribacterales bacterium]|jgi:hypothetical protein